MEPNVGIIVSILVIELLVSHCHHWVVVLGIGNGGPDFGSHLSYFFLLRNTFALHKMWAFKINSGGIERQWNTDQGGSILMDTLIESHFNIAYDLWFSLCLWFCGYSNQEKSIDRPINHLACENITLCLFGVCLLLQSAAMSKLYFYANQRVIDPHF